MSKSDLDTLLNQWKGQWIHHGRNTVEGQVGYPAVWDKKFKYQLCNLLLEVLGEDENPIDTENSGGDANEAEIRNQLRAGQRKRLDELSTKTSEERE